MDDCQHVDQTATERIVSGLMLPNAFYLWKNLQLTPRRGDHAHHPPRTQRLATMFKNTFPTAPGKCGTRCDRGNAICLCLWDGRLVITIADALPLTERAADHDPSNLE